MAWVALGWGLTQTARAQWRQTELVAADGAADDELGRALALSGDTLLVGAPGDDDRGADTGSAAVYVRSAGRWSLQQKLLPVAGTGSYFGAAVAISGSTAAIGAYGDAVGGAFAGAVYLFDRTGNTWSLTQTLRPSSPHASQFFGYALALENDTLVVGASGDAASGENSGAAYVFSRSSGSWSEQQKLTAADADAEGNFGVSVAISADSLLVGASGDTDSGAGAGAAYVFLRSGVTWSQQQKLVTLSGSANDYFGSSVALHGDTALVGALGDDTRGADAGAAYVFARGGATWSLQQKLFTSTASARDYFGFSVALDGNHAAFGAINDSSSAVGAGSVTFFTGVDGSWFETSRLVSSDAAASDFFGYDVALSGNDLAVGANGKSSRASDAGAAYVFTQDVASVPLLGGYLALLAILLIAASLLALRLRGKRRLTPALFTTALVVSMLGCEGAERTDVGAGGAASDAANAAGAQALTESVVSLTASRDTSVRKSAPNTNFGASAGLDIDRSIVDFDTAAIVAAVGAGYVVNARIELPMVANPLRRTPKIAVAYRMIQDWTESGATWNCALDADPSNSQADCSGATQWSMTGTPSAPWIFVPSAISAVPASLQGTTRFDVTDDVRRVAAGQVQLLGFLLRGMPAGERTEFTSRETSTPPRLVLTVRQCQASACDDGDACTQDVCDATAQCAHPVAPDGTSCNDGNACTQVDVCQAGSCSGANPVVCAANGQCRSAGVCDPGTGACSQPIAADGTSCSDGNACTQLDICSAGVCNGGNPVSCATVDACHPGVCNPVSGVCSTLTACTLYGVGSIPPTATDGLEVSPAVLEDGTSNNSVGAFGSAIDYTGVENLYLATPDRGPNNGLDSYSDRVYQIRISLSGGTVSPQIVGAATLKRDATTGFSGLASFFDAMGSSASRRLDPEGVRVSPAGTFYVSDEYGPYLYEFDASGQRQRALVVPSRFLIDHPSATDELPPANTKGRQSNRGMEGLALTPSGQKLYGLMQSPLIQDGALNGSNSRVGLNVRLLEIDVASGATRELLYQLSNRAYGLNEILAINDHQFLVIERDGNGGTSAAFKQLFLIDIDGASDISGIDALPSTGAPSGVTPVSKVPFLNLLAAEYGLAGANFPEKIEGLTFGPDLPDGRHVLVVTNDNDFLTTNNDNFYVFALAPQAIPEYEPGLKTFSSSCEAVSCQASGPCRLPGSCNPGSGLCSDPAAPQGTLTGGQTSGDCQRQQCDGSGHAQTVADDSDLPSDGNQCTADQCSSGVASYPPAALGTACAQNGGVRCDGAGACVSCTSANDCPGSVSECAAPACTQGACGMGYTAAGTPVSQQATGDCRRAQCDGAGGTVSATDDSDLPVDGNPCTQDVCTAGLPSHPPTPLGTSCGASQLCDGNGNCVGCITAQDCPGVDTVCAQRVCNAGACGVSYTAANTHVGNQSAGDCHTNECDGAGNLVNLVDDSDVPDDANQCTNDLCASGVASHSNKASGTSCSQSGGDACDGNGTCATSFTFSVVRMGDGTAALSSAATPVFVEKHKLDGTLLGTVALPTAANGSNRPFADSGTATSDGSLSLSADGRYLVLAGYGATPGTASVASTASNSTPRVIARIDANGVVDTTTALNAYSGNNIRGATSFDGTAFWAGGTASAAPNGVVYATLGATTTVTTLVSTPTNVRWTAIFAGQLYASSGSNPFTNVFTVGTGRPTSAGQTATSLPGMPTAAGPSPYGFVLFDRDASVAGLDTLYVADDRAAGSGGGVQKWSFNGSTWSLLATSIAVTGGGTATAAFRGLTGIATGGSVTLAATTADAAANRLVVFVDSAPAGSGSPLTGTTIATAPTNTAYRGVALSPH